MKFYILLFSLLFTLQINAQENKTKVLTLGTFHFNFPNKDFVQTEESNQIDVLEPEHQEEIMLIVEKLKNFNPSIIVIEHPSSKQQEVDSLFNSYLADEYDLKRNERDQIGFRLAKQIGIKKLYCVDEWGTFNQQVENVLFGNDSIEKKKFTKYYQSDLDSSRKYNPKKIFKEKGILTELKRLNDPENIKKSLGNYLIGPFTYESETGDFFGVNFETGRWFNRNLKIFRNIQRIKVRPEDKILVIYGAGHMNVLNLLFESSPEYQLVESNDFL
ncbi:DUF5694 domain-containing protein [Gramella sp. MAR_2010_147]|uniref:DUF5694 domain-containing protein n=1 Tax=Gramella sp. MAR_2010_147 TaxID=1250205 RepID=UPI00087A4AC4|nr:DUF5694 domain-containing protein [Gramella sp. MAR_2010_147]SDS47238.1 hypothetical protein SAMN04488553_2333 [Gramella sp. MAR_2010_147]